MMNDELSMNYRSLTQRLDFWLFNWVCLAGTLIQVATFNVLSLDRLLEAMLDTIARRSRENEE